MARFTELAAPAKAVVHVAVDGLVDRVGHHDLDSVMRLTEALDRELARHAPGWERPSADEAVLAAHEPWGADGSALDWAGALRAGVSERLGLDVAVGIAATRVAARFCARLAGPSGVLLWLDGYESELLASLPIEELDELRPRQVAALRSSGVRTLGELAALEPRAAREALGSEAVKVLSLVRGLDDERERGGDPRLARGLSVLSRRLGRRLAHHGRRARGLELSVTFEDGVSHERYTLLPTATDDADVLASAGRRLLAMCPKRAHPVVGLALTATGLTGVAGQLTLFQRGSLREMAVQLGRTS